MDSIADWISDKDRIETLEKRLAYQISKKHGANKSRDKLISEKVNVKKLMVNLQIKGVLLMSDKEIADTIFCTEKSIVETRSRLINA